MKAHIQIAMVLIFFIGGYSWGFGQPELAPKSVISIENQHLLARVDNPLHIVVQQNEPVTLDQLSATLQVLGSEKLPLELVQGPGCFIINPHAVGIVEINITIGDTLETKSLIVKPLKAIGRLSTYRANTEDKIRAAEFKAQIGISATIECYGYFKRCNVKSFQVIRVSSENRVESAENVGAKFDGEAKEIIKKAESGDIFIFRQIKHQCFDSEKPERLDDMIFEIM
jgi:hypothetical protein